MDNPMTISTFSELASLLSVWQTLRDWLSQDEEGQVVLDRFQADPEDGTPALGQWLQPRAVYAPSQLRTYISDGRVDKLINIAKVGILLITPSPPTPPSALYQLPRDITDFTDRLDELTAVSSSLEKACEDTRTALIVFAIAGMPGVGKSALAIRIAHHLKAQFPDAQLYADLRRDEKYPRDPFDILGGFLPALGVDEQSIPKDMQGRMQTYRSSLEGKKAIVLLDNADDESQIRPLLPGNSMCAVLVTSRRRLSALAGVTIIDLEMLEEEDGVALLGQLAGTERVESEPESAKRIVDLCGRLPLAIRIAGSKLGDKPHWSLEQYASLLVDERRRLDQLHLGDLDIRASFALSYQDLPPNDARLFRLLGLLPVPGYTPAMAATLLEIDPDTAWESLERLVDLQLLEPPDGGRYQFHDLVLLFAREKLEQEEQVDVQQAAQSRAKRWYLTSSNLHFYAQAEILDEYVHPPEPTADSGMLEAILTVLRTREDLRRYFFRTGPSAAWAPILYEQGFFKQPPPPEETEQGYSLPPWDVLYYLNSIASQAPDVVVRVAETLDAAGWYISRVIRALREIPAERSVKLLPRIIGWLDEPSVAAAIANETADLIVHFVQSEQLDAALDLMQALTAPIPSSEAKTIDHQVFGAEARSKFITAYDYEAEQLFEHVIPQLAALAPKRVVSMLQEHLITTLRLEAEASGRADFEAWSWRAAIEDTGQDLDNTYRDRLVRALRDALSIWVQTDAQAAEAVTRDYLHHDVRILRRLGFYILSRFSTRYKELVTEQLQELGNLDDTGIHHEFLVLLQVGFPLLDPLDQESLVTAICNGPPPERVEELVEWARKNKADIDLEEYARSHVKTWIRERLWMLQEYLANGPAEALKELNEELGPPPIPPSFTRWSSGGFVGREVSPKSGEELAAMSPEELIRYINEWQPDGKQFSDSTWVTYGGLAQEVANVILAAPEKYEQHTAQIALYRPEFAYGLLKHIRDENPETPEVWEFATQLCETVLEDPTARSDMTRVSDGGWVEVRRAILHLIELGINNEQHRPPEDLLPRVRDILLVLLDDPDPDEETDRPPEGHFGYEDPATVAINAVRPRALICLIEYAELRAMLEEEGQTAGTAGPGPKRLEPVVQDALTQKLNRQEDPSWAVHSVYGRHLFRLFWLDKEWTEDHIDEIFPAGEDEDNTRYYTAAWDSYVSYHRYWHPDLELLRPKYQRAIYNIGKGCVTRIYAGLSPETGLAVHIAGEYLRAGYNPQSPAGPHNLIALLYQEATPGTHSGISWFFWQIFQGDPSNREAHWPKVRAIWNMRSEEVSAADDPTDFDAEMKWFALLLPFVPEGETLASLWPLLEPLIPYITKVKYRTQEWDAVEEYLASQVERDPVRAIRLYHQMHEHRPPYDYYRASDESRKIIETAAADNSACRDALSLINLLARHNDEFRDVYERHKDCLGRTA
jgi:hypothetical protein